MSCGLLCCLVLALALHSALAQTGELPRSLTGRW
jgi:hypothetical protein